MWIFPAMSDTCILSDFNTQGHWKDIKSNYIMTLG